MTTLINEEIDIAVAKICGIHVCRHCWHAIIPDECHCGSLIEAHGIGSGHNPVPYGCTCGYHDASRRKSLYPDCPTYCNDLNAMHEAEKFKDLHWTNYTDTIYELDCPGKGVGRDRVLCNADAMVRALAFLKVNGVKII
jgi:hypothetical protein